MSYLYRLGALVFIAAISPIFFGTKAVGCKGTPIQSTTSAPVIDTEEDLDTLLRELFASIEEGKTSYDAIRIVSQIGRLGPQATPAVDILIELLGKPFPDCDEGLRVCPNNTLNCVKESRVCPVEAEMRNYDYLTPYAFAALQQIGVAALPKLSAALDDGTLNEESMIRRRLVAGVMGSIGPASIPFLSDSLRASDYTKRRLALGSLYTVLSKDPSSGNQLTSLVSSITLFFNGDFETTDQAIFVLGAIGPGTSEAVPRLEQLLSYKRVLPDGACPVGERTGYIFQAGAIDALVKIGTPDAMRAVERYKVLEQ